MSFKVKSPKYVYGEEAKIYEELRCVEGGNKEEDM